MTKYSLPSIHPSIQLYTVTEQDLAIKCDIRFNRTFATSILAILTYVLLFRPIFANFVMFSRLRSSNFLLSSVFIREIIYYFFNVCAFDCTAFDVCWKVRIPLTGLTPPVGWQLVTPKVGPKSFRKRRVIEVLVASLCCLMTFFNFLMVNGFLYIGLGRIAFLLSSYLL